ncbi:MAG: hypothetical protein AAF570_15175, partial [Bacteroidota bacterium]
MRHPAGKVGILEILSICIAVIGLIATIVEYNQSSNTPRSIGRPGGIGLSSPPNYPINPQKYSNLLNYSGVPSAPDDYSVHTFSDLGAWHGYSLSPDGATMGFSGPKCYSIHGGSWISPCLSELKLGGFAPEKGNYLPFSRPGRLQMSWSFEELSVFQWMVFLGKRTAGIRTTLTNKTENTMLVQAGWTGKIWEGWQFG